MVDPDISCLQRFRLSQCAGHTVQKEAVLASGLGYPFRNDVENDIVGNQGTFVHEFLDFPPQLRAICHGLPEHVPGRNGGDGELLGEQLCLCPLSGAGRAQ